MRQSVYIALMAALAFVAACESDYSYRGDTSSIAFSADTLSFDTVFTEVATATTQLMIYNRSNHDMTLDRVWLKGGSSSPYNVNINGQNTTEVNGLRLRSGDSLYVFVNVMPPASDSPIYSLDDELAVSAGNNVWTAHLLAYGLNVRRITGHISDDTTLDDAIPYLVSGTLEVDTTATLTLSAGTIIYMGEKSRIDVYGHLQSQGTFDNQVTIKAARTEKFYHDIPGQWHSISLMPGSGHATMEYTEIANSIYGLMVDSATTATLNNVTIRDAMKNAVVSYAASTSITNCLLYNCGSSLLAIYGGHTDVIHCTLSNYYRWDSRLEASIVVNAGDSNPEMGHILIANTVVVGNQANEMELDESLTNDNTTISHCYMRLGTKWKDDDERLDEVIIGKEPGFIRREASDFHLTEESPLRDAADVTYATMVPFDYDGRPRTEDNTADIGALEYNPEKEPDENE